MSEKVVQTICGFCHTGCGMNIHLKEDKVERVTGVPGHPTSDGYLCPKGLAAKEFIYSPHRLEYPLRKTKTGFQRISWNDALMLIAEKLEDIKQKYGPQALVRCGGAPVTAEAAGGFLQFMAAYGSPNLSGASHLCAIPRRVGFLSVHGERTDPDYEHTRYMIMWGANPLGSFRPGQFTGYGRFDNIISKAQARGAKLVVIDPRRTELAGMADEWVQINLGTDLALALAMTNVVVGEELYDREFVEEWALGFTELKEHVKSYSPKWASGITGVPEERIRRLAREYATIRPGIIYDANGLDMHINTVQTVRAIHILIAITGNLSVLGGVVPFPQAPITPEAAAISGLKRLSSDLYPLFPPVPFTAVVDALLTGKPYQPRALIVHHANPVLVNANERKVREALDKLDFIVVSDIFLTATAQMADIILPAASDFERYDFRNFGSAKGGFVALRNKVLEPRGESRPVFDTEYELAKKMEIDKSYPWKNNQEWVDHCLKPSGITLEELKRQNIIYTTPPLDYNAYKKVGFNTPSKKVELYSKKFKEKGYDPLPTYSDREAEDKGVLGADAPGKYPLKGTTLKSPTYVHTKFRNLPMLHKIHPEPLLVIHPDDAGARGIENGNTATVHSPNGVIKVQAKLSDEIGPGTVAVDYGWGNPNDGGANVNIVTDDELRDPISGSPPIRHFRCQVAKG